MHYLMVKNIFVTNLTTEAALMYFYLGSITYISIKPIFH